MSRLVPTVRSAAFAVAVACGLVPSAGRGQGCLCGTPADEFRAAAAGLVREWIVQLPFDSASTRLEEVAVGDGLVVATSGDGGIHAIRAAGSGTTAARPGTVAWSKRVGAPGHSWPATVGSKLVVVASDLTAYGIERDTGAVAWKHPTGSLTAASAVQSGPWVYVPMATNRLLRLAVNPLGGPVTMEPQPAAPGRRGRPADAPPTPPESPEPLTIDSGGAVRSAPVPLDAGVLWVTDNGLAALEWTAVGWLRHQLPESNPPTWAKGRAAALAGQPAVRGGEIYLASATGSLARVDLNAKNRPGLRTSWTTLLPDRPSAGPMVSGDVVVVPLGPSGVAAFSAADGRELWRSELVGTLLAVVGGRAWLLDSIGRLTALDLAGGSRRQSLCVGCFTLPVVAPGAERLVLASPGGLVVSLAPPAPPVSGGGRPQREEKPARADPAARLP